MGLQSQVSCVLPGCQTLLASEGVLIAAKSYTRERRLVLYCNDVPGVVMILNAVLTDRGYLNNTLIAFDSCPGY